MIQTCKILSRVALATLLLLALALPAVSAQAALPDAGESPSLDSLWDRFGEQVQRWEQGFRSLFAGSTKDDGSQPGGELGPLTDPNGATAEPDGSGGEMGPLTDPNGGS